MQQRSATTTIIASLLCMTALWPMVSGGDDCENHKRSCNENAICGDRLTLVFSACSTGRCTEQCRRSVVELYGVRGGQELLDTDLSCLEFVSSEITHCNLWPRGETVYCEIAKKRCDWNSECAASRASFESQCVASSRNGQCSDACSAALASVFKHEDGVKLLNCFCPSHDDQCEQVRLDLDGCKDKALQIVNSAALHQRCTVTTWLTAALLSISVFVQKTLA